MSCRLSASYAPLAHLPTVTAGIDLRGARLALTLWCPGHSTEALEPGALALSADSVTLPRRLPAGRQRGYGLFRRFVWRWFARVIGYMDSSETLRYWRYARLQLAAEEPGFASELSV